MVATGDGDGSLPTFKDPMSLLLGSTELGSSVSPQQFTSRTFITQHPLPCYSIPRVFKDTREPWKDS
jgi:hypothetical protein